MPPRPLEGPYQRRDSSRWQFRIKHGSEDLLPTLDIKLLPQLPANNGNITPPSTITTGKTPAGNVRMADCGTEIDFAYVHAQ